GLGPGQPKVRAEEGEQAERAQALEQVLEVVVPAVAEVVRSRRGQPDDAPHGVEQEREEDQDRQHPLVERMGRAGDPGLPRARAVEGGEVVPQVHHRPHAEGSNGQQRGETGPVEGPRGGGGGAGRPVHAPCFPRKEISCKPEVRRLARAGDVPGEARSGEPATLPDRVSFSSLRQACARLLVVGYPGTEPDAELRALVDEGVLGAILFGRNVGTPEETAARVATLKRWAGRPFPVSVDQEGGRVARFRGGPFARLPPMRTVGE